MFSKKLTFKNVEFFVYLKKLKGTSSTPTFFFCFPIINILQIKQLTYVISCKTIEYPNKEI